MALERLVAPAVPTMELQRGVVGDLSPIRALADTVADPSGTFRWCEAPLLGAQRLRALAEASGEGALSVAG